jgi:crotonobetainyl-CoA:carnitine CoA-transferase CaiB-like acyl-CoA transferase
LQARERTGRGQDVDVALYEAVWRMSGAHAAGFGLSETNRERSANYFPGVVPAEQFETSDGHYVIINATTQRVFERLCEAMGQPELVQDPRFTPRKALQANYADIHQIVGRVGRHGDDGGVPAHSQRIRRPGFQGVFDSRHRGRPALPGAGPGADRR